MFALLDNLKVWFDILSNTCHKKALNAKRIIQIPFAKITFIVCWTSSYPAYTCILSSDFEQKSIYHLIIVIIHKPEIKKYIIPLGRRNNPNPTLVCKRSYNAVKYNPALQLFREVHWSKRGLIPLGSRAWLVAFSLAVLNSDSAPRSRD